MFVRHASERDRLTNTGHWAALALEGSSVVEQGVPREPLDGAALAALSSEGAWALFPGPHGPPPGAPPPRRIVVPDGTWQQARRIMQRVPALRALPRLPLPPAPGAREPLRRPLVAGGRSTIEAVAGALRALGDDEAAERLEVLHAEGVALVARLGGVRLAREAREREAGAA